MPRRDPLPYVAAHDIASKLPAEIERVGLQGSMQEEISTCKEFAAIVSTMIKRSKV